MRIGPGIVLLGVMVATLCHCAPHTRDGGVRRAEPAELQKVRDDAGRECYARELGSINLNLVLYNEKVGSLKSQIVAMYVKATGNSLTAVNALGYEDRVLKWVRENATAVTDAYYRQDLLPGHLFLGIQPNGRREKQWHFFYGKDVVGLTPGRMKHTRMRPTHTFRYRAGPETLKRAGDFLAVVKKNRARYHWNAAKLKRPDPTQLTNCVVLCRDALRAAGIDTSDIDHLREPWGFTSKCKRGLSVGGSGR